MVDEALRELEAASFDERLAPPALHAQLVSHMAAKHWDIVIRFACRLVNTDPNNERAWIAWAHALRELNRIPEALAVLNRGVLIHGEKHAVIYYDLARYSSLLGQLEAAGICLKIACEMDRTFRVSARGEPDLKALFRGLKKSTSKAHQVKTTHLGKAQRQR